MVMRHPRAADESDDALMVRAGGGDRAACQQLVERHLGRIVTFAYCTLANRSDAQDVAQEVFLRVWATAPRWKAGSGHFTSWLRRVAMNFCLDHLARKREASRPICRRWPTCAPSQSRVHAAQVTEHVGGPWRRCPRCSAWR